ncbi:hypothetical protein FRC20_004613, partial [Serendipita sp. 405]
MQRIASSSSVSSLSTSGTSAVMTSDSEHEHSPTPTELDTLSSPPMSMTRTEKRKSSLESRAYAYNNSMTAIIRTTEREESPLIPPPPPFKQLAPAVASASTIPTNPAGNGRSSGATRACSVKMSRVEAGSGFSTNPSTFTTSQPEVEPTLNLGFLHLSMKPLSSSPMSRMNATSGIEL